jgi:hypothetical protein
MQVHIEVEEEGEGKGEGKGLFAHGVALAVVRWPGLSESLSSQ